MPCFYGNTGCQPKLVKHSPSGARAFKLCHQRSEQAAWARLRGLGHGLGGRGECTC